MNDAPGTTRVRSQPIVFALVSLIALLVLAVAALFAFGGSGSDQQQVLASDAAEEGNDSEDLSTVSDVALAVTYDVFLGRDPFEPVVPEPVEVSDPADPSETDPAAPSDPLVPSDPAAPSAPPSPAIPASAQLIAIGAGPDGESFATIRVGTTTYEVSPGEMFADIYLLIEIGDDCATWLRGDVLERGCLEGVAK